MHLPGALNTFGVSPFGRGRVVLNQECQAEIEVWLRQPSRPPANNSAVRSNPFAVQRIADLRTLATQQTDGADELRRRQRNAGIGPIRRLEQPIQVPPEQSLLGQVSLEDANELDVAVAKPDQAIERARRFVPAPAARPEAKVAPQLIGRRVWIGTGDDQVVDPGEHLPTLARTTRQSRMAPPT